MTQRVKVSISKLKQAGIEVLPRNSCGALEIPIGSKFEAPCSLKWVDTQHFVQLGMFSYQVSGFLCAARIGRYCSIGEDVQIGRQSHPMDWASTSPAFYLRDRMFDVGSDFDSASEYNAFIQPPRGQSTKAKFTTIEHDVWIGHGAFIAAGTTISTGAVVAAHSVVVKDVPPFAVVAGNPAVIKKWRLPAELISPMLKSKWWEFSPWALSHCDPAEPAKFVHQVMHIDRNQITPEQFAEIDERGQIVQS